MSTGSDFSILAVAAEAGIAVATVYRHFNANPELVDGLFRHYFEQIATRGMFIPTKDDL